MDDEREMIKKKLNKELWDKQWLTRLAQEVQWDDNLNRKNSMVSVSDLDKSKGYSQGPRHDTILSSEIEKFGIK